MRSNVTLVLAIALIAPAFGVPLTGCSTAPKAEKKSEVLFEAASATTWFKNNVSGLNEQIDDSAGYVIFPDVAQWGLLIGGGEYGRGVLCRPDGSQIGWAAINTGSIGLQAGIQGFKMLMILEDDATLQRFMANNLDGQISGVAVAATAGGSVKASFTNGVAAYQGANGGLMAGVNIGLDYVRYEASN